MPMPTFAPVLRDELLLLLALVDEGDTVVVDEDKVEEAEVADEDEAEDEAVDVGVDEVADVVVVVVVVVRDDEVGCKSTAGAGA